MALANTNGVAKTYEADFSTAPWIEFSTNTARTILSSWTSKATQRLRDLKFIFCHGGGVMPILLGRMAGFSGWKTRSRGVEQFGKLDLPDETRQMIGHRNAAAILPRWACPPADAR